MIVDAGRDADAVVCGAKKRSGQTADIIGQVVKTITIK